jgi:PAS domain S-box-containing protein
MHTHTAPRDAAGPNRVFQTKEEITLDQVISHSHDGIFVTDKLGNVIMANPAAVRLMEQTPDTVIGANVQDLVKKGVYERSTTMEAINRRAVFTGLVKLASGVTLMSTSMPIFDDAGEIVMVVTNTRDKDLVDKYIAALAAERDKADRYKTAAEYLSGLDSDNKTPVAESAVMRHIIRLTSTIAKVDTSVLLLGESGSGKDVIARHIHRNSPRAKEPFIPVNCAAIPDNLMESEFFGYVRGAFTGASTHGKPGIFEIADKGTLFLDEIAELPLSLQSKLLRVLETGEVQRLGSASSRQTHVRLIAATNKDLKQMVDNGLFRSDLYYRLNVIPVSLPPLRDRPEDIRALSQRFLEEFNKKYSLNKTLSPETVQSFQDYSWPGNVRELRNVVERLVIISPTDELSIGAEFASTATAHSKVTHGSFSGNPQYQGSLKSVVKMIEAQYIDQVLKECGGRLGEAARRLGIHRSMLYRKICQSNETEAK